MVPLKSRTIITKEDIQRLAKEERALLHRHGVRLRVDRISRDGRYALCTTCQVKRPFFRRVLSDIALVSLAHKTFMNRNVLDLQPLITAVPKGPLAAFVDGNRNDPFGLLTALRVHRSNALLMNDVMDQGEPLEERRPVPLMVTHTA